ncbi:hypothetical protein ACUVJH_20960 [Aeromonas veronii]|uniref:hypothetical protein n=1 Tax=Aeromonas veronii TaxID=654 RepID=UPI004055782C
MKCLSIINDRRISATSVLIEMTIGEYINFISGAEDNLEIQRNVVKGFKPYVRLREDLEVGCVIPPIVIGVKNDNVVPPSEEDEQSQHDFISAIEQVPVDDVYIIDGLQRTEAIKNVLNKLHGNQNAYNEMMSQRLRVEIWPDITLSALTYRMILLNAGQKPMSLKHQLEVISHPLCKLIQRRFEGDIDIYTIRDQRRRVGPGQYQFSVIASSFQAFIQRKPHIEVINDVIAEINQIDVLEKYGESISAGDQADLTEKFVEYVSFLLEFDRLLCDKYDNAREVEGVSIPSGISLLSRETFHLGLAAAYGYCLEFYPEYLNAGLQSLLALLQSDEQDPLALYDFERIQAAFSRRVNTGEKTRDLVCGGIKEFLRSEGRVRFSLCWTQAGN